MVLPSVRLFSLSALVLLLGGAPALPAQQTPEPSPPSEPAPSPPPSPAGPVPAPEPPAPVTVSAPDLSADPPAAGLFAEGSPAAPPQGPAPVSLSQNVTINLINRLVQRGALTQGDAADLIRLAEADAAAARVQQAAAPQVTAAAPVPPAGPDEVRVTYIPETVRNRLRDEIKSDLLNQSQSGKLTVPGPGLTLPKWVNDVDPFADFRLRYDYSRFPAGNDNTGAFPNFNSINTGAPFDVSGTQFSPQYNVDADRQRLRLRARFGAEFDLEEGFTMGFRLGTGENTSPVTSNQSLGLAGSGQGGNFSKYAVWLDRAFLKYEYLNGATSGDRGATVLFGRFDNPFFSTDITWDDELGFDGLALQGRWAVNDSITPFFTAGAFPVFNTDFNFSSNRPSKFESTDKWLYGAQLGVDLKLAKDLTARLGLAYFEFQDIEGKLSDPYTPINAQDGGNTDGTRPSFAQKGNTYRPLRNITPDFSNNFGASNQFQYFGLATPFRNIVLTGKMDYTGFEPFTVSLSGEYVKNTAFDQGAIDAVAVNNRGPNGADGALGAFDGDDTAWNVALRFGSESMEKRGAWQGYLGYRRVGSDAVVDGFTESDFGGGGTNMKGFTAGGILSLSERVRLALRWMSADQIAGPPLKNDTIQLDLSAKF